MMIKLYIDGKESMEIGYSDLSIIVSHLSGDEKYTGFISQLYEHPASEVRCAAAINTSLPIEILDHLANDSSIEVVHQVASNSQALKLFGASLIKKMIRRDVAIAIVIADNLNWINEDVQEDIISTLLQHSDPKVIETAQSFRATL